MKVDFGDFKPFIKTAGERVLLKVTKVDNDEEFNTTEFTLENEKGEIITNKFQFNKEAAVKAYYAFSNNLNGGNGGVTNTNDLLGKVAEFDIEITIGDRKSKSGDDVIFANTRYSYPATREFVPVDGGGDDAPKTIPTQASF